MLSQGIWKTICLASKMACDQQQHQEKFNLGVPQMSQLFVAHSPRICRVVGTLQGFPFRLQVQHLQCYIPWTGYHIVNDQQLTSSECLQAQRQTQNTLQTLRARPACTCERWISSGVMLPMHWMYGTVLLFCVRNVIYEECDV